MVKTAATVVVIVGYKNARELASCVKALGALREGASFDVFIAENGGAGACEALANALSADSVVCRALPEADCSLGGGFARRYDFELLGAQGARRASVHLGATTENLGYAGGINAWLRPLLLCSGWTGVWILNPDTQPAPDALDELLAYAASSGKGMIGCSILSEDDSERVHSRGLAWRKLFAKTLAVDLHAPLHPPPDLDEVEPRLQAPSGASTYVTRELIEKIGLMEESFFLYFEDLDWGYRAKSYGGVGFAHKAIVRHIGGTTIGSGWSPLSIYLEIRNRVLFARRHHPSWVPWTIVMQVGHALRYASKGGLAAVKAALQGLAAGVRNETGRPEWLLAAHGVTPPRHES